MSDQATRSDRNCLDCVHCQIDDRRVQACARRHWTDTWTGYAKVTMAQTCADYSEEKWVGTDMEPVGRFGKFTDG